MRNKVQRLVVFCPRIKKRNKQTKKKATVNEKRTIVKEVNGGEADAAEDG